MAKELSEYLKELYPAADDSTIDYYISLIENHDQDRLPATKEMKEWLYWDRAEKEAKAKKDELRSSLIMQKDRLNHNFQLVNINKTKTRSFNSNVFYNWVSNIVSPEILEELTIKTIDEKKFIKLEAAGKIEYDNLPEDCFTATESWRIEKSRKKNERD